MSRPIRRHALRAAAVLVSAGAMVLVTATPALARVTAQPGTAEQGGYSVVTLRVPTESDTAGTVALQVSLPTDHPITSVRTTPRAGWSATLTRVPLDPPVQPHHGGAPITEAVSRVTWTADPGVRVGPGEFVAWDQPTRTEDGSEPERPAPTVTLVAPSDGTEPADSDDTARWLGGAGLLVGALGLGLGGGAVLRTRKGSTR